MTTNDLICLKLPFHVLKNLGLYSCMNWNWHLRKLTMFLSFTAKNGSLVIIRCLGASTPYVGAQRSLRKANFKVVFTFFRSISSVGDLPRNVNQETNTGVALYWSGIGFCTAWLSARFFPAFHVSHNRLLSISSKFANPFYGAQFLTPPTLMGSVNTKGSPSKLNFGILSICQWRNIFWFRRLLG